MFSLFKNRNSVMNLTRNAVSVIFIRLVDNWAAALVEVMVITYPGYLAILQSHLKQNFNSFLLHYIALYHASFVSFITRYYTEIA